MKNYLTAGAALLLTTTAASAGGIDRTLSNYGTLFEVGNYAELSFATVKPNVSGDYSPFFTAAGGGVSSTGDMATDFSTISGSVKYDLTPRLALGLYANQPFGADAKYNAGFYQGLAAEWDSKQLAIVLKYKITPNISVYGGARSIESQANIAIPDSLVRVQFAGAAQATAAAAAAAQADGDLTTAAALGQQATALATFAETAPAGSLAYTATTESNRQTSYIAGIAYERPEIALRVALTYESGYTHDFATTESDAGIGLVDYQSTTNITMPDVYTLDFQSGVAKDTLVFGSIRHATWSDWEVRPEGYATLPGNPRVTGIDTDVTTYRIGVGRKINDSFSAFARVTYEAGNGDELSRLAPTDGSTAFGIGGTYSRDAVKVTAGLEYITFGDGTDNNNPTFGTVFAKNDAVALGVSVGYRF